MAVWFIELENPYDMQHYFSSAIGTTRMKRIVLPMI